jgi:sec-independent protein translocase protein TatA
MLGSIGMPEMIVIFLIALIVLGPRRLPDLSLGRAIAEFRNASRDLQAQLEAEVDAERAPSRPAAPAASDADTHQRAS